MLCTSQEENNCCRGAIRKLLCIPGTPSSLWLRFKPHNYRVALGNELFQPRGPDFLLKHLWFPRTSSIAIWYSSVSVHSFYLWIYLYTNTIVVTTDSITHKAKRPLTKVEWWKSQVKKKGHSDVWCSDPRHTGKQRTEYLQCRSSNV